MPTFIRCKHSCSFTHTHIYIICVYAYVCRYIYIQVIVGQFYLSMGWEQYTIPNINYGDRSTFWWGYQRYLQSTINNNNDVGKRSSWFFSLRYPSMANTSATSRLTFIDDHRCPQFPRCIDWWTGVLPFHFSQDILSKWW